MLMAPQDRLPDLLRGCQQLVHPVSYLRHARTALVFCTARLWGTACAQGHFVEVCRRCGLIIFWDRSEAAVRSNVVPA